ncbi:D-alanyl-D-alanine carboxypeptidase [Mogibacterium sp. BX12]|uniref:serine-type D-Ala-D-Ala carboxypeptidase n=2 Tax=Zhenpiania hominis TaxID=2763644 RepID=A0A923NJQ0_9FIRM|nr:D-alanyl-D-alanine carboxypeptidase family protein [Zhenpiania hominis]MBC6678527.1 D-alanyl-D-alanine carboxypeptidase [Zhenpiania hominis]
MGIDQFQPQERSISIVNARVEPSEKETGMKVKAKAAVLMDAVSGEVLFAQNAHKKLPPASVTKVMTMLLILEGCDSGKIRLSDTVTISERAASMGGSQMYMEPGEQHTVEELLKGVAMVSANDGCVALAEHLAGSVEMFVEQMNKRAAELGMKDSHFVNTNGLPVANHYTSAYDIAVMSRALIAFPETAQWFTKWQDTIKVGLPGKEKEFGLTNTNKLIKQYPGAIGIKTGFTQDAGYCLSGAAERDGTRLIGVILGCTTSNIRFAEIKRLLDYGFSNYESVKIAEKGQVQKALKIEKGTPSKVDVIMEDDAAILVKKGNKNRIKTKIEMDGYIKLPLKRGQKLGELVVLQDGKEKERFPIVARDSAKKASIKELYIQMMKKLIET